MTDETKKDKIIEKDVTMLANLKWSDTDNFYMNLGCHKGVGLVVCGDDKGSLWLYNCPSMVATQPDPIKKVVEPSTRLMWPELQDDHLENSRKVPLDRHDIIIDKVSNAIVLFSKDQKHELTRTDELRFFRVQILSQSLYIAKNTLTVLKRSLNM